MLGPAIDALRDAPNSKKAQLVARLAKLDCNHPDLCALRSQCLAAYRKHVTVLETIESLEARLGHTKDTKLETELQQATRDLVHAEEEAQRCARRQADITEELGR